MKQFLAAAIVAALLFPVFPADACTIVDATGKTLKRTSCDPYNVSGLFLPVKGGFVFTAFGPDLTSSFIPTGERTTGYAPGGLYGYLAKYYVGTECAGQAYQVSRVKTWGAMWELAEYVDSERIYFASLVGPEVPSELIGSYTIDGLG